MRLFTLSIKHLIFNVLYIFLFFTIIDYNVVVNGKVGNSLKDGARHCGINTCTTQTNVRNLQNKNILNKRQLLSETTATLRSSTILSPQNVTRSFSTPFLIDKYLNFKKQCQHYSVTDFFKRDLPKSILPVSVSTSKYEMYKSMILKHATQLANRHEFWPFIGFYLFSQKTLEVYTFLESTAFKQWFLKSLMRDAEINKDLLLSISVSTAISMLSNNLTLTEAVSSIWHPKVLDDLCIKKDEYFCMLHSLDKNAEFVNATEYCSKMENEGITMPFLQQCERPLMTENTLNFDMVAYLTANQTYSHFFFPCSKESEGNHYLLALKAIENLNRWFDYHRFCPQSMLSGLKENFLDIDILPSWKSIHYFYVNYNKTLTTPAAVLARKVQTIKKGSETIVRFLLVVRDARTTIESFTQIDTDTLGQGDPSRKGIYPQGYAKIFAISAASIIENIIRSEAQALNQNHTIHVTVVAKGSYGVGSAMLILRELIDALTPDTLNGFHFIANVKINYLMMAFSSNLVGDNDFIDYLKDRATFRNIVEKNFLSKVYPTLLYPCESESEPPSSIFKLIGSIPEVVQVNSDILDNFKDIVLKKFEVLQTLACPLQSSIEHFVCGKTESLNETIGCHSGQKFYTSVVPKF